MRLETIIKAFGGVLGAICSLLFGAPDAWLIALVALSVIDYLTGVTAAGITKQLSSSKGLTGILKKVLLFSIVAVANIIDNATSINGLLRDAVIGFLAANEGLSILENCAKAGMPIPKKLRAVLEQLRDKPGDVSHPSKEN